MSLVERLRLDEVISSLPELGPTAPDGGYSWIVLFGVIFIQVTVPSILSMYGIVLGYLAERNMVDFDLWNEKITLTPILFVAFWSLADPWTRIITDLASIPQLVGLVGVALLTTGVIASGYLATGGVGAYLASLSAGAVMGVGASFVIMQSEVLLRKHFRVKLSLVLSLKNIATSFGFTFVPAFTHFLLEEVGLKVGLPLIALIFIPTALSTLVLRSPAPQRASSYRLLLSADDNNELGIKISSDVTGESENCARNNGMDNVGYAVDDSAKQEGDAAPALFSEVNNIYAYQEPDEDVELFVSPIIRSNRKSWWKQELYVMRYFRFWAVVIVWIGVKTSALFFWLLISTLFLKQFNAVYFVDWVMFPIIAGIGTFIASVSSCWTVIATAQCRRLYFGVACWLVSLVFISLTYANDYYWFLTCSLLGGVSINSLLICQDTTLYDVLGNQFALRSYRLFSTFVGLGVLAFCFMHDEHICLRVIAFLQFFGGCYWIIPPVWEIVKARRCRKA